MLELEKRIRKNAQSNEIQLMTHLVAGYPDFETNGRAVEAMSNAGVEFIEIQIPFSEPMADGPVIVRANQEALKKGAKVRQCFDFIRESVEKHPDVGFIAMTYANIPFQMGFKEFSERCERAGVLGSIIPDLPPEHFPEYIGNLKEKNLSPIHILTPTTPPERMKTLNELGGGMLYCMGRTGVTGRQTQLNEELGGYLENCRRNTRLPLGVGFGIRSAQDVAFLKGKVELAILGSKLIEIVDRESTEQLQAFLTGLR